MTYLKSILRLYNLLQELLSIHPFLYFASYCRWKIKKLYRRIPEHELNAHRYITGKTGSGKSSYMEQWIYGKRLKSRTTEDCCIIVLDPHGNMVENIRKFDLSKKYFSRLVYIDPCLMKGYTCTLNPLECWESEPHAIELRAQQLLRVFQELIPDATLSNYMRALLHPCLYVLLTHKTASLVDLQDLILAKSETLLTRARLCGVPAYEKFFREEFFNASFARTKLSLYTKIQSLLNSQIFYHMTVGNSTINLEQCRRNGKIVLFNLSKGKIGEEAAETFGRFIIAEIKALAFKHAGIPVEKRKRLYLVIDEADSFISTPKSISTILKETRKYGLSVTLITQNLIGGRGYDKLRRDILSNTNVKDIGINSVTSLKPLATETGFPLRTLQRLDRHEFFIKYGSNSFGFIRTSRVFHHRSPLLLKKGEVLSQTHKFIKQTPYYKVKLLNHIEPEDWMDAIPKDLHDQFKNDHYPSPKFTY